jgi:hypothetical protein
MSQRLSWAEVERLNAKVFAARMRTAAAHNHAADVGAVELTPQCPANAPESVIAHFDGPERVLHDRIAADLRERRLYFVHSRTDKRTTTALGVPDFIIALSGGGVLWCEVKRKGGKLTAEQTVTKHVLLALGHKYALVFNFEQYQQAIKDAEITLKPT